MPELTPFAIRSRRRLGGDYFGAVLGDQVFEPGEVHLEHFLRSLEVLRGTVPPRPGALHAVALLCPLLGPRPLLQQPQPGLSLTHLRALLGKSGGKVGDFQDHDDRPGRDAIPLVVADLADEPRGGRAQLGADGRADVKRRA